MSTNSTTSSKLPYAFQWSREYPHVAWADLHNNKVLVEIAVLKLDPNNGDLYYIPIAHMDDSDRKRLVSIVTKRDAHKYPLWDLMANVTLKNGMNALEYFHQLVSVRTAGGQIMRPSPGKIGVGFAVSTVQKPTYDLPANERMEQAEIEAAEEHAEQVRRGPGRPRKS